MPKYTKLFKFSPLLGKHVLIAFIFFNDLRYKRAPNTRQQHIFLLHKKWAQRQCDPVIFILFPLKIKK